MKILNIANAFMKTFACNQSKFQIFLIYPPIRWIVSAEWRCACTFVPGLPQTLHKPSNPLTPSPTFFEQAVALLNKLLRLRESKEELLRTHTHSRVNKYYCVFTYIFVRYEYVLLSLCVRGSQPVLHWSVVSVCCRKPGAAARKSNPGTLPL